MILEIFYIIPSIVCLVWAGIFLFRKRDDKTGITLQMLLMSATYFCLYILLFTPGIDYMDVCIADVVAIPLVLALLAALAIFVNIHQTGNPIHPVKMQLLYIPAIAEGSVVGIFYYLIGTEKIAKFYSLCDSIKSTHPEEHLFLCLPKEYSTSLFRLFYYIDVTFANILVGIMILVVILVCGIVIKNDGYKSGDFISFWLKGKEITPAKFTSGWIITLLVTVSPLVIIGRTYIMQHPWIGISISIALSIEIFMLCQTELINFRESFTLHEFTNVGPDMVDYNDDDLEDVLGPSLYPMMSERALQKTNAIEERLKEAMEKEKVWLDPDLKLGTLADELGTNRNKLSVLVNHVYRKDFKLLVAEFRVKEAQHLMKDDPAATLEWIAAHCGFKDQSLFSHRFKDIVGKSPTEWRLG